MRFLSKINIALGAVFAAFVLLNLAILQSTVAPEFEAIEESGAQADFNRALEALDEQLTTIKTPASDYGAWDDTDAFVTGTKADYADVNLTPETFATLNVNLMLFADKDGKIVWAGARDLANEAELSLPPFAAGSILDDGALLSPRDTLKPASALIATQHGLMFIGVAPITKSDRAGPATGVIVTGRLLDVEQLKARTKVDLSVVELAEAQKHPLLAKLQAKLVLEEGASAKVVDDRQIARAGLLSDLSNRPIALVSVRSQRSVTATGNKVLTWATIEMVIVGALILLFLRILLNRIEIKRLERLRTHFTEVTTTGALRAFEGGASADGHGALQACFNDMVVQANELKDRLTEQSFHSGRAEVVASTLHNVRNSLSPIATLAQLMQEDEETGSRRYLSRAIDEIANPQTAPARREKLREYVVQSASRLVAESAERSKRLEQIAQAATEIDLLLAQQDHVSRTEQPVEALDTVDLIKRASASALRMPSLKITFDLPETAPRVRGHRTLVLQVLENLFANSAEAVRAAERAAGHIAVRLIEHADGAGSSLEIGIEDNGDGIAADRIERIFHRGESTRKYKHGGMGLHWSANTVAAMGGKLYATSPGDGRGATLHLVLPLARPDLQKAA